LCGDQKSAVVNKQKREREREKEKEKEKEKEREGVEVIETPSTHIFTAVFPLSNI
jgi:hypothetical protein